MKIYKVATSFAGVGGLDLPFHTDKQFETVFCNDFNPKASITYKANFGEKVYVESDISTYDYTKIPNFDIFLGGFPCQPFSIAGERKGFSEARGTLFFNVCQILQLHNPEVVVLENVKGLLNHDKGNTLQVIFNSLKDLKYTVKYKILNSKNFGLAHNRERIFIVGFKDIEKAEQFTFTEKDLSFSNGIEAKLEHIINFNGFEPDNSFYYTPTQFSKYYDWIKAENLKEGEICQIRKTYVRKNKNNICPTLTANMGTGGHNVPIIKDIKGFRKLTPYECFKLQGFPSTFSLPNISKSHLYQQAGNAVSVPVANSIKNDLLKVL